MGATAERLSRSLESSAQTAERANFPEGKSSRSAVWKGPTVESSGRSAERANLPAEPAGRS